MRMNRKGQALIEFIIILPVLIMLIFSFIDLGRIILENNRLEAVTTDVVIKYKETKNYSDVLEYIKSMGYKDVDLSIKTNDEIVTIKLDKKVELITPGLDSILGNPYSVSVERVVGYE